MDLGTSFGTSFGALGSYFRCVVDPTCNIGFQVAVYDVSGRKSHGNLMVGCAETIINMYVFVRFRFLGFLSTG